ncbi:hypothetical protein ASG33_16330 [Dyadobacter sp. Leaf189]|nr:hypothetical protein ASG33_16330 [Dyadobacter sp. Leaf189]
MKQMHLLLKTSVCALLCCLTVQLRGQGTLQVATRTIEKNVAASTVRVLHINAEKADIEVSTWDKNEISIVMQLSARHPDRAVAARDLAKIQYLAERTGKDFFLRNYILLKDGEMKPQSNVKAHYKIQLPATCEVDLKNTFGTILLKGLLRGLQIKADFCNTTLADIEGKGQFNTSFGELKGSLLSGSFTLTSDHTKVVLTDVAGTLKVDSQFGNVEIHPSAGLTSLAIRSKKTEVMLVQKNWQQFDYNISSAYTSIKLPNGFKWKKNTPDFKEAFFSGNRLANVLISAEFGNVTIR